MTSPSSDPGHLERLTRRLHITAYVSGGLVVFTAVAAFASWSAFFYFFVLTFYPALFVLMVSSIGAIVGRLLLAARRDEQSAEQAASGQDWFE